jgi:transposase, IS5 family
MHRRSSPRQLSFQDFYLPFGGHLSGDNRWVKLAEFIPWDDLEDHYAEQLDGQLGTPAKPFRVALGSLIIQQRLGISDRETIEQIRENPYLQYFLGFSEYRDSLPFDASSLVHFRKRLTLETLNAINNRITQKAMAAMPAPDTASETDSSKDNDDNDDDTPNQGQLLLDATCAPADIHYPTDLKLLNRARELTEQIIDILYKPIRERFKHKPRPYRRTARQSYLSVAKQRRPSGKMICEAVGKQLQCIRRNLGNIDRLLAHGASLSQLPTWLYQRLLAIAERFVQQQQMHQTRTHRIDDRIVSLSQPHLRPIVRGKAGMPVEFGVKLSVSCVDGFVFFQPALSSDQNC